MIDSKEKEIRSLVEDFLDGVFLLDEKGNKIYGGFCNIICHSLSVFLELKKYPNAIESGSFGDTNHTWIRLTDYEDCIIDPTIRQFTEFDNNTEIIHIGYKPTCYNVNPIFNFCRISNSLRSSIGPFKASKIKHKDYEYSRLEFKPVLYKLFARVLQAKAENIHFSSCNLSSYLNCVSITLEFDANNTLS